MWALDFALLWGKVYISDICGARVHRTVDYARTQTLTAPRMLPANLGPSASLAEVLGLVLGLLLVEGLDLQRGRARLQAEEAGGRKPQRGGHGTDAA